MFIVLFVTNINYYHSSFLSSLLKQDVLDISESHSFSSSIRKRRSLSSNVDDR